MLWGLQEDQPLARVHRELSAIGAPVVFVNQREVLAAGISLDIDRKISGLLTLTGLDVELEAITAAYVRPYDYWRIGAVGRAGRDSDKGRHALGFDDSLWLWAELTEARVVNRPSAMASNGSKPRQAMTIRSHGFEVPDTLVTTDADAARSFQSRHGEVVYKSVSGVRSIVSRLGPDDVRLEDVAWCPTQFQEFVPGTDYRVHVVGDDLFCAKIESEADDYRYGASRGVGVSVVPASLPDEWSSKCLALSKDLGLHVTGIDLRRTPAGAWYCFEVNPSPAFTFYDRHDQGIGSAIARLLAEKGDP